MSYDGQTRVENIWKTFFFLKYASIANFVDLGKIDQKANQSDIKIHFLDIKLTLKDRIRN